MNPGKAFELLVKHLLLNLGFTSVPSDDLYIFDGAPGQMIQGLGEAHNADVLLEPPVQTPFYSKTRLLIECKDYRHKKVGLNTLRSALGLREDINHFDVLDLTELSARRRQQRRGTVPHFGRCSYQVAVASYNGFTAQAQEFAATHRIPLIEFNQLPFWKDFCRLIGYDLPEIRPAIPNAGHRAGNHRFRIPNGKTYGRSYHKYGPNALSLPHRWDRNFVFGRLFPALDSPRTALAPKKRRIDLPVPTPGQYPALMAGKLFKRTRTKAGSSPL